MVDVVDEFTIERWRDCILITVIVYRRCWSWEEVKIRVGRG